MAIDPLALLNIPAIAKLAIHDQWINWRYVAIPSKQDPAKVPCDAKGWNIDYTDLASWQTFQEACDASAKNGIDGIGFVFTSGDPFCGLDLDLCIDESGNVHENARDVVEKFNSTYWEISPSGRGLKGFMEGSIPKGGNKTAYDWDKDCPTSTLKGKGRQAEIAGYDNVRYFCVTGRHYEESSRTLESCQPQLDELWRYLHPVKPHKFTGRGSTQPSSSTLADEDIMRIASRDHKFRNLYAGHWQAYAYPSQSEADDGLMVKLAFYTRSNAPQMIRLFEKSSLWSEERANQKGAGLPRTDG